jgi:hypothetical protein
MAIVNVQASMNRFLKSSVRLLILQLCVIPLVIFIFRLPFEKKVLSLFANGVFLMTATLTLFYSGTFQKWIRIAGVQFLLFAVLPITILRILSWNADFNESSLFGVSGRQWHASSNISFLIMLVVTLVVVIQSRLKSLQK